MICLMKYLSQKLFSCKVGRCIPPNVVSPSDHNSCNQFLCEMRLNSFCNCAHTSKNRRSAHYAHNGNARGEQGSHRQTLALLTLLAFAYPELAGKGPGLLDFQLEVKELRCDYACGRRPHLIVILRCWDLIILTAPLRRSLIYQLFSWEE